MENDPIVIERTFDADAEKLWIALTDKDDMKKWYFDLPEFKPETGCEFRFLGGKDDGKQYLHICVITEIVPGKKITYSWRYDGYEGISHVSFEIFPENGKTRLILTHEGVESFPESNPDLAKENFVAGWDPIINIALVEYLAE